MGRRREGRGPVPRGAARGRGGHWLPPLRRALLTLLLGTAVAASPPPPHLRCPLPDNLGLSATVGELREGHLHTGIDLRTGGRDGLRVVAAADGRVVRVRVNRRGYGNALYLEHAGGWVTVYGHLERFALPAVEAAVARAKRAHGRYPGEVPLDRTVRVTAGQLIAYSGESGAGLPHLHFELRDPAGEPVNPLPYLPSLPDRHPPAIHRVRWVPADASGRIDGDFAPRSVTVGGDSSPVVRLAGRVVVEVEADDRFTSDNRCGVYELAIEVEGQPLYRLRFDRLRFSRVPLSGLLYDLPRSALAPLHFLYKLHREAGNDLLAATGEGVLDTRTLAEGHHLLTVRVRDVAGGEVVRTLPFVVANEAVPVAAAAPVGEGKVRLTQVDAALLLHVDGRAAGTAPAVRLAIDTGPPRALALEPVAGGAIGVVSLTPGVGRIARVELPGGEVVATPLRWALPARPSHQQLGDFTLDLPSGGVFAPLGLRLAQVHLPPAEGLPLRAGPVALEPAGRMLARAATVAFALPGVADGRPLGLYRWSPVARRWRYIGGHWEAARHTLAAGVRALATVAVLEDRWVPRVVASRPAAGATLHTLPARAYVAVRERGEGVDEAACSVALDGRSIAFEYDPDRHWLRLTWPEGVEPGDHTLSVVVADKAGNRAAPTTISFSLEAPAS